MTVFEILTELRRHQVSLQLENFNLRLSGNTKSLPPNLLSEIKENKEKLIEFFKKSHNDLEFEKIGKVGYKEHYPLSNSQKRLWLLSQFEGGNKAYNITTELYLKGAIQIGKLEDAFRKSISKHESLRTSFPIVNDEPVQKIHQSITFNFEHLDFSDVQNKKQFVKEVVENIRNTVFDLEAGNLLKVTLIRLSEHEYAMLFSLHHIISDGWSIGILVQEIMHNYKELCIGKEIEEKLDPIQYKDFTNWHFQKLNGNKGQSALEYWKSKSLENIDSLNLPTDFKRPDINLFEGAIQKFYIDETVFSFAEKIVKTNSVTIFNVYRACISILLHKLSGQTELIIGTPVSGRTHPQLFDQVGLYVNTLPLVSKLNINQSFSDYLNDISNDSISSFEYQDYPFDLIIENSNVRRDVSRSPLFDVLLVLQNTAIGDGTIDLTNQFGFKLYELDKYLYEKDIIERNDVPSKFDLSFNFARDTYKGNYLEIEYRTKLFKNDFIQRIYSGLQNIIKQVATFPEMELGAIQLVNNAEKEKIIYEFNKPIGSVKELSILELMHDTFSSKQNEIGLLVEENSYTYQLVSDYSDAIGNAIYLLNNKKKGSKIGLLLDRTEYLMFSVLGVLKSQNAYVPVDINYPEERISYIIEDSNVTILIVDDIGKTKIPSGFSGKILEIQNVLPKKSGLSLTPSQEDTAYLIYTSGSTGKPKGVEISNRNAIAFLKWSTEEFMNTPYSVMYAATSYCFDLSIFEMFLPLIQGKKIRILKSALDIQIWLEKDKKVFVNTVPSVVRNLMDQGISWENIVALNMAGEPIPIIFKDILNYKNIEIRNLYGPSEDTTYSTMYRFESGQYDSIPIGKPIGYTHIYILDKELNILPIGVEGEICLSGLSIAKGYLNRPELTAEKFVTNPFVPGQRIYKTGDVGKWLTDGKIIFCGRVDDQVKIRGFRIELGEIQYRIEQIAGVEQAVVIVKEIFGEDVIIAYWKSNIKLVDKDVEKQLKDHLPHYMLPSFYIELDVIPLNSNGKVDKKKLPLPETRDVSKQVVLPVNEIQKQLYLIWTSVLNRSDFGITDNFFELGGHSLKATKLRGYILREIGKDLNINEIFQNVTIESQAKILEQKGKKEIQLIELIEDSEYYPVSFTQERLWVLTKFEEASKAYHMNAAFVVTGDLDVKTLEQAMNMVVEKHESLRTVFSERNGLPVQIILNKKQVHIKIDTLNLSISDFEIEKVLKNEWLKPFDLEKGPLLRCFLLNTDNKQILSFGMHHIISDGWSLGVLYNDLIKAYSYLIKGERITLIPIDIQYKDYAIWQRKNLSNEKLNEQLDYWKNFVYQNGITILDLPTDFHRPEFKTYNGNFIRYSFSKILSKQIQAFNLKNGVSLFMTLMANVSILLKKLANQTDITVGTPVAGRDSIQLQNQIGFYVNTLPIRVDVIGELNFNELLLSVRSIILKSFDYQYFPFELLVEELQPKRDLSRSPLFDVMIVLQNTEMITTDTSSFTESIQLEKMNLSGGITKYDLTFSFSEYEDQIHLELEYNTDIYKKETIYKYIQYLDKIFHTTTFNSNVLIKDIQIISNEEKTVFFDKNDLTDIAFNGESTIVSLFKRAASSFPKNIALKVGSKELTYIELDQKSSQLSKLLIEQFKVKVGDLVALHTDRTEWMLISILAVLKSAGAYVPIDPTYPLSRIEYMLIDSGTKLLLTDNELSNQLKNIMPESVKHIDIRNCLYEGEGLIVNVTPNDLAYVIYTSGTTGNPKGVLIEHKNVSRLFFTDIDLFEFNEKDRWSLFHSYCFDFSVWEMYGALLNGGTLVMVNKEIAQDSVAFYDFLKNEKITILNQTPTAFKSLSLLNHTRFSSNDIVVRYLIFGGEALMPNILSSWNNSFTNCRLINMYGITETTVHVTYQEITEKDILNNKSLIGSPIPTLSCYVLDQDLQPVPLGVVGELCVGGFGVARGYHNKMELTKQKFVDNPFKEGQKIYRSGDFARVLDNGNIEYIGRKDEQVKIRGHRIELGEIETALAKSSYVKDAIVLAIKNSQSEFELVAYYISNESIPDIENIIRISLREKLPAYMIPSYFVCLDFFPLTPNGKLDKKALPTINTKQERISEVIPPRNEIDQIILDIWKLILDKEVIGIRDNFFDLGGHSLKATRILSAIQEKFGIRIDLKNLFIDPTIEHLSNYIDTMNWMVKQNENVTDQDELVL